MIAFILPTACSNSLAAFGRTAVAIPAVAIPTVSTIAFCIYPQPFIAFAVATIAVYPTRLATSGFRPRWLATVSFPTVNR